MCPRVEVSKLKAELAKASFDLEGSCDFPWLQLMFELQNDASYAVDCFIR
jgi:hypothetical protein